MGERDVRHARSRRALDIILNVRQNVEVSPCNSTQPKGTRTQEAHPSLRSTCRKEVSCTEGTPQYSTSARVVVVVVAVVRYSLGFEP